MGYIDCLLIDVGSDNQMFHIMYVYVVWELEFPNGKTSEI